MNIITIIILSASFVCCGNSSKVNEEVGLNVQKKDTCRDDYKFDIKINEIELSNNTTSLSNYKNLEKMVIEDNQGLPYVSFLNKSKTEKLTLYFFYGSGYDEFYQFKIEPHEGNHSYKQLDYNEFKTESGIKLGITKKELLRIKNFNYIQTGNSLKYILSNYNSSCFLKKYNLPVYFSEYTFKNDKLIKIYFGFEYP